MKDPGEAKADRESEPPPLTLEEERRAASGRLPGNRYVRIIRPAAGDFRRSRGHYVATERSLVPESRFGRTYQRLRRFFLGKRLGMEEEAERRVSKLTGLAVLAPSNVSSSAYATEEMLRVVALAGVAALTLAMPIAFAIVAVLAIIVVSEMRVISLYPGGGGSYIVARDNVGIFPGLVAAAALLVDYVLTVAVSTAAGVIAISSVVPELGDARVGLGIAMIVLLVLGHLRGIREAGLVFAVPTYSYIAAVGLLIAYGTYRIATGDVPAPVLPRDEAEVTGVTTVTALLLLRAFAAGAVAITGTEAVANVVQGFKAPEKRNAMLTLLLMAGTLATLFVGLTFLATRIGIVPDAGEIESVNSMIARSVFGDASLPYFAIQLTTAIFLLVAANTGFSGFPRLAAVLANDRFMPRQFAYQGDRLSNSFGIVALALVAGSILAMFGGSVNALVPLYTIAVFLSFFLSQAGLLRRWLRLREARWWLWAAVNTVGAGIMAGLVVTIAITRLFEGAWLVLVLLPLIVLMLYGINRHYVAVHDALTLTDLDRPLPEPTPPAVIVPIARLDRSALQAIAFARSISPHVRAVHVATTPQSAEEFKRRWARWAGRVPLDIIESPYRSLVEPLLRYIDRVNERDPRPLTIVLAEFVPRHWWEFVLHSQTAFRLKASLLFRPDTVVINVPYHFRDTADVAGDAATPRTEDPG
ncbi:MAG TPA: APC family permease [Candidatus Limnocylindria bacterium]|nr:APC family permease [Candidatus Limnocylindria bacterium]